MVVGGSGLRGGEQAVEQEEMVIVLMVEGGRDGDVLGLRGRRLGMALEVR